MKTGLTLFVTSVLTFVCGASEVTVTGVTARQLWPHNKVALEFTVIADEGKVMLTNDNLYVWCARGGWTNAAVRILGDRSATPGVHRIIWDMEAEGLMFTNADLTFGVSVEEIFTSGVQLWENGPYWAECNIGASKPEEYGYQFWWGDTVGYKRNANNDGWVSVKDGSGFSFSSENCPICDKNGTALQLAGYINSTGNLVAAHDAATAHLGAPWRMPTSAEFSALVRNCDTTWTTRGGVYGRLFVGKGDYASKSIFLPAAGSGVCSRLDCTGSDGDYWSSSLSSFNSNYSWRLSFGSGVFCWGDDSRQYGKAVRPLQGFAK